MRILKALKESEGLVVISGVVSLMRKMRSYSKPSAWATNKGTEFNLGELRFAFKLGLEMGCNLLMACVGSGGEFKTDLAHSSPNGSNRLRLAQQQQTHTHRLGPRAVGNGCIMRLKEIGLLALAGKEAGWARLRPGWDDVLCQKKKKERGGRTRCST